MEDAISRPARPAVIRVLAAMTVALAFACAVYLLLQAARPSEGPIGFAFLLVLPAALCAFVAYVADPWKTRSHHQYIMVPIWMLAAVVVLSLVVLREGVICVILLAPLWIGSGLVGAEITYCCRRRTPSNSTYSVALLALPLIAMQVEPYIPLPTAAVSVSRAVDIHASPAKLWPLLRGIPDVRAGEGHWNVTQDLIGVPRPLGATLTGGGIGADRHARWDHDIRFRERVTEWTPGRRIAWRFLFDDLKGWGYTDEHLLPNSGYFQVTTGGYRADPIAPGVTRVTLHTEYRVRTPVNAYAALWGELFLGDLENNLLAVIRQRAERRPS